MSFSFTRSNHISKILSYHYDIDNPNISIPKTNRESSRVTKLLLDYFPLIFSEENQIYTFLFLLFPFTDMSYHEPTRKS